jgi:hypothetical protein
MHENERHRGRFAGDALLFAPEAWSDLRVATTELSWLFERGYGQKAAVKLVGDRHGLRERQRLAVLRSACGDQELASRQARRFELPDLGGRVLVIDGFNILIALEAALGGGLLVRGRDGVLRDLASVHGSYRLVDETEAAVSALGEVVAAHRPFAVQVFLDRPVSNSGRVRALIQEISDRRGWPWEISLTDSPDREILARVGCIAATSDGPVLDRCGSWVPLTEAVVKVHAPGAWIVDLGAGSA